MCVKEGRKGTNASASPCGPLDRKEAPLTDDCMADVLSISGLWKMPERGSLGRKDVLRAQLQRLSSMGVQTHSFGLKVRQNVTTAGTWGKGRVGLGSRYSTGNLFPLTRTPPFHTAATWQCSDWKSVSGFIHSRKSSPQDPVTSPKSISLRST